MDFELLYRKSFNRKGLAEYLEVSERTIKRWEKTNKPPGHVVKLLHFLNKDLSFISDEFKGFCFYEGKVYTPEGDLVRASLIRSIPFLRLANEQLRNKLERPTSKPLDKGKVLKLVK